MLQPKRTKYRKQFKGTNTGLAHRGSSVSFGEFGLKATSRARMTAREIEAARRAMTRYVKRGGQVWNRVFPDVPVTIKLAFGEQPAPAAAAARGSTIEPLVPPSPPKVSQ